VTPADAPANAAALDGDRTTSGRSATSMASLFVHDDQALDRVAQFPDVALPAVALERLERCGRDAASPARCCSRLISTP